MKHLSQTQLKALKITAIVLLALLCAASLVWFVISVRQFYKAGDLQPQYYYAKHEQSHTEHPVTVTIDSIQPWMTFNYLNVVFRLPPTYLQNALAITDPRYPNMRIDSYTRVRKLDPSFFLQNLKKALTSYSYIK